MSLVLGRIHNLNERKLQVTKHKEEKKSEKHIRNSIFLSPKLIVTLLLVILLILPFLPSGFSREKKFVMLKKGFGVSKASYVLKSEGLIRSRIAFRVLY